MRCVGNKAEKRLELASGLDSFGCKELRDTRAHFEKQSYFKGEMQENPGKKGNGDFRGVGVCGGWVVGSFIQQRITGCHWVSGRGPGAGSKVPTLIGK